MEYISVFDVFKIGVGPSSSHTLGPWKAALKFRQKLINDTDFSQIAKLEIQLYGSLSLTGKGHATDLAVILGLEGYDPVTIETSGIDDTIQDISQRKYLNFSSVKIHFDPQKDIVFKDDFLPFHANGLIFIAEFADGNVHSDTYYSVGGGFIIREGESLEKYEDTVVRPFPVTKSRQLLRFAEEHRLSISDIVRANELVDQTQEEITSKLMNIWDTMLESMYIGCHSTGYLPGGLNVKRRAGEICYKLMLHEDYHDKYTWLEALRKKEFKFHEVMKCVGNFGIAVNEVNAALGRVVTAPTNGSAGVIPAVLMYYLCFVNKEAGTEEIVRFLLTSGEIGSIFKKGSTISAAMGGCQAEIGVSSAMAAAGLTELLGGTPEQCTIAAEIAMEHHLGMTCDPIGGLVQIPCIERNSMGAIKAINAATIAIDRTMQDIKVPLDNVIVTMWETAQDMHRKYKETSEGGLATAVHIIDC